MTEATIAQKHVYHSVDNDPMQVKMHTLSNGMRLFLSVNSNEPRVFTNIVVRSGSKQDPAETTGLAHYMEHMLFKGTSKIGATNWEKEKQLLQEISSLYEKHRLANSESERKEIYQKIDAVSFKAAELVAPNEYDKLATAIGARHTNAYTWVEQTVYVNDIPSNELERWMQLESERFRMMALRLFHTELETVYEEFNISQDRDFRKSNNAIRQLLFPNHPYGTQTTLGSAEHLRKPSQVNIQNYFKTYYVPNNMGIVLAGDFDPDEVVSLAEKYFGTYQSKPIPPFHFLDQPKIEAPIFREVWGQSSPYVDIAWRFGNSRSDDQLMIAVIKGILHNEHAGLFDLNLTQEQKVLEAEAWYWLYEDYSVLGLYGKAREGQSLKEVEQLLLAEIDKLKNGEFEDWLLNAIVKDVKRSEMKGNESNQSRVSAMTLAFVLGIEWEKIVNRIQRLEQITKAQIVDFAKKHLQNNYAVVYKQQGEDPNVIKVKKPPITPVQLQREALSDYAKDFLSRPSGKIEPKFEDFKKHIKKIELASGLRLDYVHNPQNQLFRLDYIFEMGKSNDLKLGLALIYFPYLGTDQYTANDLKKAFYRLGISYDVFINDDRAYITLSGLDESLEEGVLLFEHLLNAPKADQAALQNVISDILVKRMHAKGDKDFVLRNAMLNYGRYGQQSPFTHRLTEKELTALEADELTTKIKQLTHFEHRIYYYGPRQLEPISKMLEKHHTVSTPLESLPPAQKFIQVPTEENQILFLDFPMVQVETMMISRGTPHFNLEEFLMRELYNEYFGYGLSSIVFQEIRESKALAYSTYAMYTAPSRLKQAHYLQTFVGTQPDKLQDALETMLHIVEEMPVVESLIEQARLSILKKIESGRMPISKLYWDYINNLDIGYEHDLRQDLYKKMQSVSADDLVAFHKKYVKGRAFTFLVMGSKDRIDLNMLKQFGKLQELSLEEVFGY